MLSVAGREIGHGKSDIFGTTETPKPNPSGTGIVYLALEDVWHHRRRA